MITDPVKITLEMHGREHSISGLEWDIDSKELLNAFKRLMVLAGFSPYVLDDEDGHWEWVNDNIRFKEGAED